MQEAASSNLARSILTTHSLINSLNKKFSDYKSKYKRFLNGTYNQYITVYEVLKKNNAVIRPLNPISVCTIKELKRIEGYYIKNTICVNKKIDCRTQKQWYKDTRLKRLQYQQKYYKKYKQQIKIKNRNRYNRSKINKKSSII